MSAVSVLLVEDDVLIGMDLEDELTDGGFDVVGCARSVSEARSLLDRRRPDAAVLDIHLHGETTFELAEELDARGVPYVFLSGNGSDALPEALRERTLLTKPPRFEVLATTIRRLTGGER